MSQSMTVVLSRGPSHDPAKWQLEETLVAQLILTAGIEVVVIPHLYDLTPNGSALLALRGLAGDFVLLSWLYPRAAHWTLDRHNVRGRLGEPASQSDWEKRARKRDRATSNDRADAVRPRVLDDRPLPRRTIYHLDLRMEGEAQTYVQEIRRLAAEHATRGVAVPPPTLEAGRPESARTAAPAKEPTVIQEPTRRRWYPVIDFSRCTNCMECMDFCLFGVYGIDGRETILVEQPDNCRRGCPACSRICPENAIIFPQHKTPTIAGDPSIGTEMKINLSQLFGKPSDVEVAALERDEHVRLAGHGPAVSVAGEPAADVSSAVEPPDELDDWIEQLDRMDL